MEIQRDSKGQAFIEWHQPPSGFKRAWVRHAKGEADWAGTGRYINVVRVEGFGSGPAGNSTDFPVYRSDLSDEQVLAAFVYSVCTITGCAVN